MSRAIKHDFQPYILRYTSPNENFEYGCPHSKALLQCTLKLKRCKPYVIKWNMTSLMTSYYILQYIAGYTVTHFWHYPIRCPVTKQSTLEFFYLYWLTCWVIFHAFVVLCWLFSKICLRNPVRVSNGFDPGQDRCSVGPDLGPNCLERWSANNKNCHWRAVSLKPKCFCNTFIQQWT